VDPAAKNRNENTVYTRKENTMDFKEWLEARSFDCDKLTELQRTALQADFEAEQKRSADDKCGKL
jgi:hypothetical protein